MNKSKQRGEVSITWESFTHHLVVLTPVWLTLIAVVLYWYGHESYVTQETNAERQKLVYSIAGAVLGGGVFAAILKSFQYANVFKEELRRVIYGDTAWLATLPTWVLRDLLNNVLLASIKKGVPSLAKKLGDGIINNIAPKAEGYAYGNMSRRIDIRSYDPQTNLMELTEEYGLTILPASEDQIKYAFSFSGEWPSNMESQPYVVDSLEINTQNYLNAVRTSGQRGSSDFVLSHDIALEGQDEYRVSRHMTRRADIASDPVMQMVATRFTDSMKLTVCNRAAQHIKVEMLAGGIDESRIRRIAIADGHEGWEVDGLIFPGQGLILVFTRV